MKKNNIVGITVITLMVLGCIPSLKIGLANDALNNFSDEQKDYVMRYLEAVNSDDFDKLSSLAHSSYLECINSTNQDYYDHVFQQSLKREIPESYHASIEPLSDETVAKEIEGAKQLGLPYPVRPTHRLQIDYTKSEYSFVTIVRNLTLEDGKYYETSGCPTSEMLTKFREMNSKKEQNRKRAELLFQQLNGSLLSELTQILKEGRKIDAWKKYSDATGESLATAKEVLSHIQTE